MVSRETYLAQLQEMADGRELRQRGDRSAARHYRMTLERPTLAQALHLIPRPVTRSPSAPGLAALRRDGCLASARAHACDQQHRGGRRGSQRGCDRLARRCRVGLPPRALPPRGCGQRSPLPRQGADRDTRRGLRAERDASRLCRRRTGLCGAVAAGLTEAAREPQREVVRQPAE